MTSDSVVDVVLTFYICMQYFCDISRMLFFSCVLCFMLRDGLLLDFIGGRLCVLCCLLVSLYTANPKCLIIYIIYGIFMVLFRNLCMHGITGRKRRHTPQQSILRALYKCVE